MVCLIFAMTRASGLATGTSVKGSVALVLVSGSDSSLPGRPACPGTHWKLRPIRKERELERSQISQKNFSWRNGVVERRARGD